MYICPLRILTMF